MKTMFESVKRSLIGIGLTSALLIGVCATTTAPAYGQGAFSIGVGGRHWSGAVTVPVGDPYYAPATYPYPYYYPTYGVYYGGYYHHYRGGGRWHRR